METEASRLRLISLFEDLPEAELAGLARALITRTYARHALISGEDEHAGDVFLILEGTVRASSVSADGREIIYSDLGAGEIFGEFSAIDGQPRSSSLVATSDCLLGRLPAVRFRELVAANPGVSRRLIELLVAKIRRMSERRGCSSTSRGTHATRRVATRAS